MNFNISLTTRLFFLTIISSLFISSGSISPVYASLQEESNLEKQLKAFNAKSEDYKSVRGSDWMNEMMMACRRISKTGRNEGNKYFGAVNKHYGIDPQWDNLPIPAPVRCYLSKRIYNFIKEVHLVPDRGPTDYDQMRADFSMLDARAGRIKTVVNVLPPYSSTSERVERENNINRLVNNARTIGQRKSYTELKFPISLSPWNRQILELHDIIKRVNALRHQDPRLPEHELEIFRINPFVKEMEMKQPIKGADSKILYQQYLTFKERFPSTTQSENIFVAMANAYCEEEDKVPEVFDLIKTSCDRNAHSPYVIGTFIWTGVWLSEKVDGKGFLIDVYSRCKMYPEIVKCFQDNQKQDFPVGVFGKVTHAYLQCGNYEGANSALNSHGCMDFIDGYKEPVAIEIDRINVCRAQGKMAAAASRIDGLKDTLRSPYIEKEAAEMLPAFIFLMKKDPFNALASLNFNSTDRKQLLPLTYLWEKFNLPQLNSLKARLNKDVNPCYEKIVKCNRANQLLVLDLLTRDIPDPAMYLPLIRISMQEMLGVNELVQQIFDLVFSLKEHERKQLTQKQ